MRQEFGEGGCEKLSPNPHLFIDIYIALSWYLGLLPSLHDFTGSRTYELLKRLISFGAMLEETYWTRNRTTTPECLPLTGSKSGFRPRCDP